MYTTSMQEQHEVVEILYKLWRFGLNIYYFILFSYTIRFPTGSHIKRNWMLKKCHFLLKVNAYKSILVGNPSVTRFTKLNFAKKSFVAVLKIDEVT